ncbi:CDP-alcohol phosphatidyltransferase family protein [Prosthecobacter dejongeii]|uniref:Phosphatidylglycerophosphate synthase n=1 Tax=Prosthecobacter dejongeii TaxID=48465 RepID=A0A7W8DQD0_9BACT|nr:CDP-alcohol phosphatidyltransferase family protein [Prosthecobacter dejongeii]MBB5038328.1 phosphatidylglycerophosphate synthase [Prosthecobacter dejongeii]
MSTPQDHGPRRELKSRNTGWARLLARWACASHLSPNAISLLSIVFATVSLSCFLGVPEQGTPLGSALLWFGAAAGIQLRLLCNLMDGMVAVEGGRASATGPIFNEVPDRVADVFILVGAGYSTRMDPGVIKLFDTLPLGWSCAILAMATAYIRLLQGTLTGQQSFIGPMAKQHRMAVLTVGALAALVESLYGREPVAIYWALVVIFVGSILTFSRRLSLIVQTLKKPSSR